MPENKVLDFATKNETHYCIPIHIRDEQIRTNIRRVKGRVERDWLVQSQKSKVKSQSPEDTRIAIVGYGPSLADTWEQVKQYKHILTCSGSHKYLLDKGLKPADFQLWGHVEVDPRDHKIELLGEPQKGITYLPASCCHPKYVKHIAASGAEIKLWHVFARDGESEQVIPRGEYSITGGCDVGMRAMTLARFFGYTDFHIFGLDGSEGKTGKHAGAHPNQPKQRFETTYNGRKFFTTPALKESAKQVFHELDQMPDVKFTFYGDGLIQEMAKSYTRTTVVAPDIAEMRPELISDELRDLNARLHEDNPYYGVGGGKYADTVLKMRTPDVHSILDYGAGKQQLAKSLPFPIWSYDPAIPEIAEPPRPADLVICTDVLEHIEPDKLQHVLDDLRRVTQKIGYFVIHLGAAKKTYADGRNCHLIQQDASWWAGKLKKYFDVSTAQQKGMELHVVVTPRTEKVEPTAIVGVRGRDGIKSRFYVPNATTRWRAETLVKKEPCTIDWIQSIPRGSTLWDIGANVGGYTIWAGVRGVNVVAFEPEAENYALLCRNIALNNLDARAFCLAVSDSLSIDTLHMSTRDLGGSCHTFGAALDPFGKPRESGPLQGCVGISIDELVQRGVPAPDYIKLDVDGLEPQVIKGAIKTLKRVKGLIIEVNPALASHLTMVDVLTKISGFTYSEHQVKAATRRDGAFKGVAEYIFYRESAVDKHVADAVEKVELVTSPFPHLYIPNVLPSDEYRALLASLPADSEYAPIKKVRALRGYPQRFVAPGFGRPSWTDALGKALKRKFGIAIETKDETLLIRDLAGYKIGPHTDHGQRVLSAIYYLAPNGDRPGLGTSIYVPRDGKFTCPGGPHHALSKFDRVDTFGYLPNSMFVFLKTDNSFHGVEETTATRDVLLYDLQRHNI